MPELKPCPFCGSDRVMVTKPTMWQAWCMDCKAIGAASLTEQEAVEAWNTRASGWIPCSERMPDEEMDVLIYCPEFCEQIKRAFWTENSFFVEREDLIVKPNGFCTHWMPLPEPPEEVPPHVD